MLDLFKAHAGRKYVQGIYHLNHQTQSMANTLFVHVLLRQRDRQMMSPANGFAINGFFSLLFTEDAFLEL